AEGLDGGVSGGPGADNHDRGWTRCDRGSWLAVDVPNHVQATVALHHTQGRDRVERGRANRLTCAHAEACMVPGTAPSLAVEHPLGQGPTIVCAGGRDREELAAHPRQEHRLAVRVAQ